MTSNKIVTKDALATLRDEPYGVFLLWAIGIGLFAYLAEKVAAAPDGYHVVWNEDLGDWKTATEVASISNLLG